MTGVLADLHLISPAEYSLDLVLPYPDDAVMSEVNRWDYAIDREKLDPDRKLKPARDWLQINMLPSPEELSRIGRDVERMVLARAVKAHLEHRIIVAGRRTVIFSPSA